MVVHEQYKPPAVYAATAVTIYFLYSTGGTSPDVLYSHVPEKSIAALGLTECPLESREGDRCAEQEGGGLGSPGNARSVQTQFRISLCTSAVVDDCSSQIDPYLHNLTWLPPLSVCLPTVYLISWL